MRIDGALELRLTFADGLAGELEVLDRMRGTMFAAALTPNDFAAGPERCG